MAEFLWQEFTFSLFCQIVQIDINNHNLNTLQNFMDVGGVFNYQELLHWIFYDLGKTIVYVKMRTTSYTTLMKKAYTNCQQLVQFFARTIDVFYSSLFFSW